MARGNWQRRVERVEARRKESKEDKQKQRNKKQQKQRVQELVRFLDKLLQNQIYLERLLNKRNVEVVRIHIWTDSPTSANLDDSDSDYDEYAAGTDDLAFDDNESTSKPRSKSFGNADLIENSPSPKKNGRMRSKSMHEAPIPVDASDQYSGGHDTIPTEIKKNRSNSISEKHFGHHGGKKKCHPRSNVKETDENAAVEIVDDRGPLLILSRSFFFSNKFDDASRSGRKNGVISSRYSYAESLLAKTLCSVVITNENDKHDVEILKQSERASQLVLSKDLASVEPGSMEMVYYSEIVIRRQSQEIFCDQLTELIACKNVKYANVVYVAFMDVLVFDRLRDGLLYEIDNTFWSYAMKENRKFLVNDFSSQGNTSKENGQSLYEDKVSLQSIATNLPGIILTQILIFLPDPGVAAACRVCRQWNREIGQNSSHMWQHLLTRRNWPITTTSTNNSNALRDEFQKHYTAIRDVNAIRSALRAITSKKRVAEKEMSYSDFSTGKFFPSFPNSCVGIQVWSPNRLLVAYTSDCSLRLFQSEKRYDNNDIVCRELICQKIDPYRNTKKRSCQIVSMDLDDDSIGCLCRVVADNVVAEAYVLVVMTREDFLLGECSNHNGNKVDESALKVIDIGEAVLNYMISMDRGGFGNIELNRFTLNGGDIGDIDVIASNIVIACGYGRFMVEVRIKVPDDDHEGSVVDRRLVLFSTRIEAIVWMEEDSTNRLWAWPSEVVLACRRRPQMVSGSRTSCSIAITSIVPSTITLIEISPVGEIQETSLVNGSILAEVEAQVDGWVVASSTERQLLISSGDIVTADNFSRLVENSIQERKVVLSFYPRFPECVTPSFSTISISEDVEIVRMVCLRDDYMLLFCRRYIATSREVVQDDGSHLSLDGFLFHIPTRCEIGRICLMDRISFDVNDIPLATVDSEQTIGVGLSWKGIIMTGEDVRSLRSPEFSVIVQNNFLSPRSNKIKKKGAKAKKPLGKKDGFARGMSLRG